MHHRGVGGRCGRAGQAAVARVARHAHPVRLVEAVDGREDLRVDLPGHPHHPARDILVRVRVRREVEPVVAGGVAVVAADAESLGEPAHDAEQGVARERVREHLEVFPPRSGLGFGRNGGRGVGGEDEDGEGGEREDEAHGTGGEGAPQRRSFPPPAQELARISPRGCPGPR